MTMMFLLVCAGAFFWGITNILEKFYIKQKVGVEIMVIATMLGASVFSFISQFVLAGIPKISSGFWLPLFGAILVNLGIRYWELKALKTEDVSIVATIIGLTPVFVVVTSFFMLREFPTLYGLIGIFFATVGLYILNIKGVKTELPSQLQYLVPKRLQKYVLFWGAPFLRLFSTQGAKLALLVAVLGAFGLNWDKLIVLHSSPYMRSAIVFLVVALIMYAGLKITGAWDKTDKRFFWPLFGIGLIVGLSNVLMDYGFLYGIVPYVGAIKRTQIIWTMVFAHFALKERLTPWRLTGAIIIITGMVFIYF